jgi:hypothetical protein
MLESSFVHRGACDEGRTYLESAGSDLEKIVAQSLRQAPPAEAPLMAWPVVCGSVVAERTRALSFLDGVLRVAVADTGWRSELQSLAPRYLASINRYTLQAVRKIEFVILRSEGWNHNLR